MASGGWNPRVLAVVGLAAGVIQALAGIVMYVAGVYFASWSMLVSVLVLLLCIVAGTRWYTARCLNESVTYLQALAAGVVISVATGLVYAVYNVISITFVYPEFLDQVVRARIAQAAAHQQPHESFEVLRAGVTAAGIAVSNLVRLSVIGSVLSALAALFLRRRR